MDGAAGWRRAGPYVTASFPAADYPRLVPEWNSAYPSYFIYGSLVFSAATEEYLGGMLRTKYATTITLRLGAAASPLLAPRTMGRV